jgi:hypothetical protein
MADGPKIFSLHYKGSRFRNARLPVDVLSDLPAFRDLLVSYAKDDWRRRHPDRLRVPKGFDKSLSFDLIKISDGSAIPQLEWNRANAQVNLPGFEDEIEEIVEEAYGNVVSLIEGQVGRVTALNAEKIRALNRFGAGLRDNEEIEISDRKSGKVVHLDATRRKQLITGTRETYQTRFEGTGELIGTYSPGGNEGHIVVRTSEYGNINVPVDPLQIYEEFASELNHDIQFELLIELDSQDRFRSVIDVYEIVVVFDELRSDVVKAMNRLSELRSLPKGWHNGTGIPMSNEALLGAEALVKLRPAFVNSYHVFPTESGGILIDFEWKGWDFSVEFAPGGSIEMYGIEIAGRNEMKPKEFSTVEELLFEFDRRTSVDG